MEKNQALSGLLVLQTQGDTKFNDKCNYLFQVCCLYQSHGLKIYGNSKLGWILYVGLKSPQNSLFLWKETGNLDSASYSALNCLITHCQRYLLKLRQHIFIKLLYMPGIPLSVKYKNTNNTRYGFTCLWNWNACK